MARLDRGTLLARSAAALAGVLVCLAMLCGAGAAAAQEPAFGQVPGSPFAAPDAVNPLRLAFSPGGRLLAVANYGSPNVSVFHVAPDGTLDEVNGSPFATGGSGPTYTSSVAFSPGGKLLAATNWSASTLSMFRVARDGTLQLVGSPVSTRITAAAPNNNNGLAPAIVAFSPDGKLLATSNNGGWDVSMFKVESDGRLDRVPQVFRVGVNAAANFTDGANPGWLAFSPDGELLATSNTTTNNVTVFHVAPNGVLSHVDSPFSTLPGTGPLGVAFSPDGRLLATTNTTSNNVSLFEVAQNGTLAPVASSPFSSSGPNGPADFTRSVSFSPGGGLLAAANGNSSNVSVFDVVGDPTLEHVPGSPFAIAPGVYTAAATFSPLGGLLATANMNSNNVSVFGPTGTLQIAKSASTKVVRPGGVVSYVITVHNPTDHVVVGAVSDDLSGVLDQADLEGSPHASSGSVTFHRSGSRLAWDGTVGAGDTVRITYSVRVHAGLQSGLLVDGVTGPPGSTCSGSATAEPCLAVTRIRPAPGPGPDLVLTKTASAATVHPGGQLTYALEVHNNGQGRARRVTLRDVAPSGVFFQSAHPSQGCTVGATELVCHLGSLQSGGQALVSVSATVRTDATGTLVNEACVSERRKDRKPSNDCDSATVSVVPLPGIDPGPQPVSDLRVQKHVSHASARVGQRLTYTITVRNAGPDAASDVRVIDARRLPNRVVSIHTTRGSCQTGPPIRCRLGTLASGARVRITIIAVATTAGRQTNTAMTMSGSWQPDPAASVAAASTRIAPRAPPPRVTG